MEQSHIRNFSIIAHIDHGKSTLADRILELTDTVEKREMKDQLLDSMELERERGITIKLNAVQLVYHAKNGEDYLFHLIDTPGHVDFTYEVSRSLAACDGAVLVVDAAQGVQAQTLANVYLALENDLEILPVLNKVDLPSAQPDVVKQEIEDLIGLDCSEAVEISAKSGLNVEEVLEQIVAKLPAPSGSPDQPLQALVFDSLYDPYRGVIAYISVKNGSIKPKDKIRFMATGAEYEVIEVGVRTPKEVVEDQLNTGDVGWISAAIKSIEDVRVGDTITKVDEPANARCKDIGKCSHGVLRLVSGRQRPLRRFEGGARQAQAQRRGAPIRAGNVAGARVRLPVRIFRLASYGCDRGTAGARIQPQFDRDEPFGYLPCVQNRRDDDFRRQPGRAAGPSKHRPDRRAVCEGANHGAERIRRRHYGLVPEKAGRIRRHASAGRAAHGADVRDSAVGNHLRLLRQDEIEHKRLREHRLRVFAIPAIQACENGYFAEWANRRRAVDDRFKDFAYHRGNAMTVKLKDLIPKQQFEIPVQAAIGGKIIARTNIKALRKNVLAKCYGGDISRKKKLLEKQKEGKKRMKMVGSVEIPQEAFMAVLSMDDEG